ncbi:type II toxin-antitoxin system RelE/ParE family toxin [Mariprofundus ferrooxydans]|uniref:type II toxin-antitoxin system RelE/ParE family toxin n=1 Tax=Mariprofundus ferrooxydans TaxID=314344 RepID=UPI000377A19A|nr:type II toxin-antitoxin system RelE/ParE family toxin [Mariprofundus ferrooxydans]
MTTVRFLAPAEEEMSASARYYEQQFPGLGHRFLVEVARVIASIKAHPDAGLPLDANTRRKLLRHFPYALLYRTRPTEIIIVAVMHQHRKPGYWRNRAD